MSKSVESFTVCSLNVMHDGDGTSSLPTQFERVGDIAEAVGKRQPDAVCFLEVMGEDIADLFASKLNLPNWRYVPNGKKNSGILIAGDGRIERFESVVLDEDSERRALTAYYAGGWVLGAEHPDHWPIKGRPMRIKQNGRLIGALAGKKALVTGDFNDYPSSPSRQLYEENGFVSVFDDPPKTFPTTAAAAGFSAPKLIKPVIRAAFHCGAEFSLDGGYAKDIKVNRARILSSIIEQDGETLTLTDHHGTEIDAEVPC